MFFEVERMNQILQELKELKYVEKETIHSLKMKEGFFKYPNEADEDNSPWISFDENSRWGGADTYAWFRTQVKVPEKYADKTLVYQVFTGKEGEWDAKNAQFLAFVNQQIVQGLDTNHTEILLTKEAKAGETFTIDLQGYSGTIDRLSECKNRLCVLDEKIEKLYYDLYVPLEVVSLLPKEDKTRIDTIQLLTTAVNMLDLRKSYNQSFYKSIDEAIQYLQEEYYTKFGNNYDIIAKCVGHTHIDVAWLWDIAQTRLKVQRSFATVLELMKHYDNYIFMSSTPQIYQFLKEDRPELYEELKKRVREGRWEPEGGMWVEADCNLTSGESLVRQIIYGKRFFREEFGVENKILWLPDVFGYSAALPQILDKTGIEYFMTTKISWNEYNKLPYDTFEWVGIDGSKVLTHFITTANFDDLPEKFFTTYNGYIDAKSVKGAWERYQQKNLHNEVLISYGYGDGGGGPTKDMLEVAKRLEKGLKGAPKVQLTTSIDYFKHLKETVSGNPKLPKWVGELYFEYHRGTLTSMARNKRYNRKAEFLYEAVEWLSSISSHVTGAPYPKEELRHGWEIICLNQFHDIIPGSSIKKVYDDSKAQYEDIISSAEALKDKALHTIVSQINTDGDSVVIFNGLSFNRNELIILDYKGKAAIYDGDCQLDVQYTDEQIMFYAEDIPAKGYKVYSIVKEEVEATTTLIVEKNYMENDFFKITFDQKGHMTSLMDKRVNREVLKEGERGNVLQAFEDKPHNWDAWDINIYYQEKMWEMDHVQSIEVIEKGPLKASIEIKRQFLDSTIAQIITIYKHTPKIDFDTTVDWKESHILVKAAFPVDIHSDKAVYDIQFGNVERPTHWNTSWDTAKFEVCGHKWADLSEDDYGVSLMNDCKYGYDIKDGCMRLTLLKSATSPNEEADKEVHYFKYTLYPHIGDWKKGGTVKEAYQLNLPVYTALTTTNNGVLPQTFSFISFDKENVYAEVVKQAEGTKETVIRVHECYNRRTKVKASFFKALTEVKECDLEERNIYQTIQCSDTSFEFEIKPYEIKTFIIK